MADLLAPMIADLDAEQSELQRVVRQFAQEVAREQARDADRTEALDRSTLDRMAELGFFGGLVPTEYGGAGLDHLTYSVLIEEMARADHLLAVLMSMPSSLVGAGLRLYGTEAQKRDYLLPLAEGRAFGAAGVTEPRSGSDVAGMTTTYRAVGDEFVIEGAKAWISNLDLADFLITFATGDRTLGRKGISAFIIPTGTPGMEFHPYKGKLGFRAISTGDVILEQVRVPRPLLLGEEGQGFEVAMAAVEAGRLGVASRAVGVAHRCVEEAIQYAKDRELFGQRLAEFQLTKAKIADMATGVAAARLLTHAAAKSIDRGRRARVELSMAKMHASDVLQRVATEAVQIHGAYGCSDEYAVSRAYRDAKVFQIIEGPNELHRLLIADSLLDIKR